MELYDTLIEMKRDWVINVWANCADIMIKKGRDYGKTDDSLSNLRDFGMFGVIVRMSDKWHRLRNAFAENKKELAVADETIGDTLDDLLNYATIARYFYDSKSS